MTTGASRADAGGVDALLASVSAPRMAATVTALASDALAGRRVGTAGGAAARAWLAEQLGGLGAAVEPVAFAVRSVPQVDAAPRVRWHDGRIERALAFGRQVGVPLPSAEMAEVRQAALGVAGADGSGRGWLVVPAGMSLVEAYGQPADAVGLLVRRPVDGDGWLYTMLAGPDPGPLPVLALDPATYTAVQKAAMAGAGWLSGNAPVRRQQATGTNLLARLREAAAGRVETLLTAHYDGVGDLPGLRQPGAADNASGVAVVLEAARVLAPVLPPGVGLSVAFLDGEEVGATGSAHHAAQLRDARARPVVINVDGAARLDTAAAVEAGGPAHGLLALLDQAGRHTGLPLAAGPVASDNRRYAAAGLAAVGIGASMAGYHSPADTPDRVDPATLAAIARLVVATVWLVATSDATLSSLIGDRR
jgi:aminopeptidase YwaD